MAEKDATRIQDPPPQSVVQEFIARLGNHERKRYEEARGQGDTGGKKELAIIAYERTQNFATHALPKHTFYIICGLLKQDPEKIRQLSEARAEERRQ